MVLLVEKLSRSLKFPRRPENHRRLKKPDASSSSLLNFRSKISEFIAGILVEPQLVTAAGFNKCFELIHTTNRAFSELLIELDYPMNSSQWCANLTHHYLSCTLHLLNLSNAITSAAARLNQSKMSILHAAALINTSPPTPSATRHLHIISVTTINPGEMFRSETPMIAMEEERACSKQEQAIAEALILCKNIGFLALGFVVSGLSGDDQAYLEIKKIAGGFDDSLLREVDSRLHRELKKGMVEVREVNMATENLQSAIMSDNGRCSDAVEEVKRRLKVMENSIHEIEKKANDLFSQVLNVRNKLLANIRLPE
ncbi:hypothetical protein C2S51_031717 [Perilla frutescens var. frutescens]|nr:hypothetical protein C2S51_031717 [Perilla frutescens var. frutescens]